MSALSRFVIAHKRIVAACWLMLTLAGVAALGPASKALKSDSSLPHKEGWATNAAIAARYGTDPGGSQPLLPVVTLPRSETVRSRGVLSDLKRVDLRLKKALPGARIASYASTGDGTFLSRDGRTIFALVYPRSDPNAQFGGNPPAAKAASHALRGVEVAGQPVHLTGFDALATDGGGGSSGPGILLEAVIAGAGALLVLAFVFGSLLAVVPIVMAVVSIMTSFLLLLGLAQLTDISPIVEFVVALIGLGVAIDYSLLMVSRWREERAHGHSNEQAVQRAVASAGRAVVVSGLTVAIGLLALIVLPIPFLRSLGYGGALIPLVSTLVATTLLPAVLAKLGPRLDWPHRRSDEKASRAWTRWAQAVTRRRWIAAASGVAVVLALALAATSIRMGTDDANSLSSSGDARQGLMALERSGIGVGALLPDDVLITGRTSPQRVAGKLSKVPGVHGAVAPDSSQWRRDGTALVEVSPVADSGSDAGAATLKRVRRAAHSTGPDVRVGGQPADNADFVDAVYGSFPLIIALIAAATFVVLARALRSLVLPVKAILLNVLSIAAAWGVLVLIWQNGYGSQAIWGIHATTSIPSWMPLMIFAFLFGLSMDYEVFILSRMREEYDRTGSTELAVIHGIGRTGRLVTCAAIILFLAFTSMASAPDTDTKIAATGLAAGILVDATVIRALIVPATVSVLGRWNWWLPRTPARLLRVDASLPTRVASREAS